jgi:putative endopeptidase
MIKKLLVTLLCSLGVFCLRAEPEKSSEGATSKVEKNPPAFDLKNMDKSIKPQDDFYLYANGAWLKNTPIPPEESRWGSFNQLIEKNNDALRVVAEQAAKTTADPKSNPEVQKVGDYYASGMNEQEIDAAQAKPLLAARTAVSATPIATLSQNTVLISPCVMCVF